jgi:hypothetical protein
MNVIESQILRNPDVVYSAGSILVFSCVLGLFRDDRGFFPAALNISKTQIFKIWK